MIGAEDIFFIFVIANMAFGLMLFFIQWYFSKFKLEEVFKALPNSYGIEIRKPFLKGGAFSRMFVANNVGMMLVFYKKSIRGGDLSQQDYDDFPRHLKTRICGISLASFFTALMMFALFAIGKYMNWLR
ncbi:hypothetical protein [Pseudomonas sp. NFX15]|uniref:hypothetical protein n=1 Tax=Pseudomonas sp. NFX15 TaxID=2816958 RepID=UPI003B8BA9CF